MKYKPKIGEIVRVKGHVFNKRMDYSCELVSENSIFNSYNFKILEVYDSDFKSDIKGENTTLIKGYIENIYPINSKLGKLLYVY